jgi:hypothetical protein
MRKTVINELMSGIAEQFRRLKSLVLEKISIVDSIQALLDFFAYTKTPLNKSQMDSFSDFSCLYRTEASNLDLALNGISVHKDLSVTKTELLHNSANYNAIAEELNRLSDSLGAAIYSLRNIIEFGNRTLQLLLLT